MLAKTAAPGATARAASFVLFVACLGVLTAQLDSSVVTLALRRIDAELKIGVGGMQAVIDAYNVAYAAFLLSGGTLGDLYGRKRILLLGFALFILGSVASGLAAGPYLLIFGRALSGLGAALLVPTSLAILAVTYPDGPARSRAIGLWASCNGIAFALGPTVGGWLVEFWGWRSIFLLIVPVSAIGLGLAVIAVPDSRDPEGRRLDLPGQGLAVVALGALTLLAIEAPHWGWIAPPTLACTALCVLAAALFVVVERRTVGAMVPLSLVAEPGLSRAMIVAGLMTFGMYGMLFLMPLFFQLARGDSVFAAGAELLPLSFTFFVVSSASGPLGVRFGRRAMMVGGMTAMGLGLVALVFVVPGGRLLPIELAMTLVGVGLGLNTGPVMTEAVAGLPQGRSGTASGLANTARMVGATLGVAVQGTVFAATGGMPVGIGPAFAVGAAAELFGAAVAWGFAGRRVVAAEAR
jgi:MFS transporter, DHA2 family, methylenomycin A resistance protein